MKKIINGKLYNTETAKEICSWSNGYFSRDFHIVSEIIFQKKQVSTFYTDGEEHYLSMENHMAIIM